MQDIHPIKAPVMVGLDPAQVRLMLLIAGGLALLALVVFLIRRFQKSRAKKQIQELTPVIGPYAAALGELDHLCREPIIDPKAFYFDLGALVKRYIGRSYAMNAVEMTTQELVKQIRFTGMDMALILEVSKFLTVSDPFRYGPVVPDPCLVKQDLACVRQMIVGMEQDLESRRAASKDVKEETA
ncbi:MAG: hypothetical protein KKF12_03410 [Proteobacteria bacterium]|nr:hypothetical protein [Desulfobacula sp.]MBU3953629.1 hypothetical protein [Pseudomonadota bacterium]MBU4129846.1 hypothetical protein [Pseudomonadota bacterium]